MDGVHKAVACHVFAGGFTGGVADVMRVTGQLEVHDLGHRTTAEVWGVPVAHCPAEEWPSVGLSGDVLFSNPRCTAWSCVTAGYSANGHGVAARQCQDTHDVLSYALGRFPVVCLESVQQAYSVGKPLFDVYTERAVSMGYRVAHVFVNAATFGNCQQRKRYFYVAYPRERQFNVSLPEDMSPYYPVLYDAIWARRLRPTRPWSGHRHGADDYDQDCYYELRPDEANAVKHLPTGWGLNTLGQYGYEHLTAIQKKKWDERNSDMPFSMHCIYRCPWLRPCQTLKSSSTKLVHPWHNRPCTIGELADIMGWEGHYPVGPHPMKQIAKGVVPAVGRWLAQQFVACLDDEWGGEDWSTSYDHRTGTFVGANTKDTDEKVIDVTDYVGKTFDVTRYDQEAVLQHHKFNVDPATGALLKPWKKRHEHSL